MERSDEGLERGVVVEPLAVVVELVVGQDPGDGLAAGLWGLVVVVGVQSGRVGMEAAGGVAAADVSLGEGAGQGEPEPGELGGDAGGFGLLAWGGRHVSHGGMTRGGDPGRFFKYKCCMEASGVAGYIASWQPSSVPAEAAGFARAVVAAAGPHGRPRAKNLLWAAGRLAGYGISLGLEPVPEALLPPPVTARFAAHAPGLSAPARRTLRTNLRFIARKVGPQLGPADLPLPRESATAPYTPAPIDP